MSLTAVSMRLYTLGKSLGNRLEEITMRMYIQPSWTDAAEDHDMWSGGNGQYRGDPSINLSTFDSKGRARMEAFSDSAIESLKKRKTSVPLADRILPQQRRVRLLTEQLYELEAEKKAGMNVHTYSQLRDILICKRERAEVLLKRATSVKPIRSDDEYPEESLSESIQTPYYGRDFTYTTDDKVQDNSDIGCQWIDDLSSENSLKKILQKGCKGWRKLVLLSQATKRYIKTLQEV